MTFVLTKLDLCCIAFDLFLIASIVISAIFLPAARKMRYIKTLGVLAILIVACLTMLTRGCILQARIEDKIERSKAAQIIEWSAQRREKKREAQRARREHILLEQRVAKQFERERQQAERERQLEEERKHQARIDELPKYWKKLYHLLLTENSDLHDLALSQIPRSPRPPHLTVDQYELFADIITADLGLQI